MSSVITRGGYYVVPRAFVAGHDGKQWLSRDGDSEHVQVVIFGLGGSAEAVNPVPRMDPKLRSTVLVMDPDTNIGSCCNEIPDQLCLSSGGAMEAILKNREAYSFLRGDALPEYMTPFETSAGVGKIRCGASVQLGYHLDEVKRRIKRILNRAARKFDGPLPKKLVIVIVFSLAGGVGSSLAVPVAALALDEAQSFSPHLSTCVAGHAITASLFDDFLTTPADARRARANQAIALRELYLAQQPEKLHGLCEALDIAPLSRPLFDSICVYDLAHSGDGAQSLEEVWSAIAVNAVASQEPKLHTVERARELNAIAEQTGNGRHELGTRIFEAQRTEIIRWPVANISNLFTARQIERVVADAIRPAKGSDVQTIVDRHFSALHVDTMLRMAQERLRPDPVYHPPSGVAKMSDKQALAVVQQYVQRWTRRGQPELSHNAVALGREVAEELLSAGADRILRDAQV